jgi:hypothetical protein
MISLLMSYRGVHHNTSPAKELQIKDKKIKSLMAKYEQHKQKAQLIANRIGDLERTNHDLVQDQKKLKEGYAELERTNRDLLRDQEKKDIECQVRIHRLEDDLELAHGDYEELVRNQQEASFKQMSKGRWLPMEDITVVCKLDGIKREIRSWARAAAVKSTEILEKVDRPELSGLLESLSNVAVLENRQLPRGLSTPKSPALLLNALPAHHLYTTIFRSPFCFLVNARGNDSCQAGGFELLRWIYEQAQNCKTPLFLHRHSLTMLIRSANAEDAHNWRSQTLRLLLPAPGTNSTEGESRLHISTVQIIADVSQTQASNFMDGAARYLLDPSSNHEEMKTKLRDIYQDAANLSCCLWTQKTTLECCTLQEMQRLKNLAFDADSEYLKPHTLVRYDEHEDHLKGRPITLIVHPLLLARGTDEGKDYGSKRIWASAEVWLDSKSG